MDADQPPFPVADDVRRRARLEAIEHAAEGLDSVFSSGYLSELRQDWPS